MIIFTYWISNGTDNVSLSWERDSRGKRSAGKDLMEIEKGFSLYKWPFLANRNWPKKKEVESRGVESALLRDYHLNDIDVRYAYIHIYLYYTEIYRGKNTHTTAEILTNPTFTL